MQHMCVEGRQRWRNVPATNSTEKRRSKVPQRFVYKRNVSWPHLVSHQPVLSTAQHTTHTHRKISRQNFEQILSFDKNKVITTFVNKVPSCASNRNCCWTTKNRSRSQTTMLIGHNYSERYVFSKKINILLKLFRNFLKLIISSLLFSH